MCDIENYFALVKSGHWTRKSNRHLIKSSHLTQSPCPMNLMYWDKKKKKKTNWKEHIASQEHNGKTQGWTRTISKFFVSFTDQRICSISSKKLFGWMPVSFFLSMKSRGWAHHHRSLHVHISIFFLECLVDNDHFNPSFV